MEIVLFVAASGAVFLYVGSRLPAIALASFPVTLFSLRSGSVGIP